MEGLEDTHKDKDWLLQQIKQNQIKIPLESNTTVVGILKACPADFISHILDTMSLKNGALLILKEQIREVEQECQLPWHAMIWD